MHIFHKPGDHPIFRKTLSEWKGHSRSSGRVPGYSRSSSRNSESDSRNAKFHSRNGISRLERYETCHSRSNSRSNSQNWREPTWKIFICPYIQNWGGPRALESFSFLNQYHRTESRITSPKSDWKPNCFYPGCKCNKVKLNMYVITSSKTKLPFTILRSPPPEQTAEKCFLRRRTHAPTEDALSRGTWQETAGNHRRLWGCLFLTYNWGLFGLSFFTYGGWAVSKEDQTRFRTLGTVSKKGETDFPA